MDLAQNFESESRDCQATTGADHAVIPALTAASRRKQSELGFVFLTVAQNPGGFPFLGAIVQAPDGQCLFAGRHALNFIIAVIAAGKADFAEQALSALQAAETDLIGKGLHATAPRHRGRGR